MCFPLLQTEGRSGLCGGSQQRYGLSVPGTRFMWQGSDWQEDPGKAEEDGSLFKKKNEGSLLVSE